MSNDKDYCNCKTNDEIIAKATEFVVDILSEKNCLASSYGIIMAAQLLMNGMIIRAEGSEEAQLLTMLLGQKALTDLDISPEAVQNLYRQVIEKAYSEEIKEYAQRALVVTAEPGYSDATH